MRSFFWDEAMMRDMIMKPIMNNWLQNLASRQRSIKTDCSVSQAGFSSNDLTGFC